MYGKALPCQPHQRQPALQSPSTKKVDGVEQKVVAVNQEFTYQLVVKNTGNVALKDVKVTDPAPKGVTMVRAAPELSLATSGATVSKRQSVKVLATRSQLKYRRPSQASSKNLR